MKECGGWKPEECLKEHKKMESVAKKYLAYATVIAFITLIGGLLMHTTQCSVAPTEEAKKAPSPACLDGSVVGTTRKLACGAGETGEHIQVCTLPTNGGAPVWLDATNTCSDSAPDCGKVEFSDIQPTLQQYCSSCHSSIGTYATAKSWASEIARRVGLPSGNNAHMPQINSKQLSPEQINSLQRWYEDGAIQSCSSEESPTHFSLDYIDGVMVKDATSLNPADRPFTRYLVTAGFQNETSFTGGNNVKVWQDAINKALNSLNDVGEDLVQAQPVDIAQTVWRIDLRNYDINATDIAAVEDGDVNINIVDNTTKGQVLQTLLNTKKPWFHADNFIDIAFRNSKVYHTLVNVPPKLEDLQKKIGVDFAGDLAALDNLNFIGSNASPIAEQKNRLIVRLLQARSQNAYYWQTFDVNAVASADVQVTGNVTANSATVSQVSSLAGVVPGQLIAANGVSAGTTVVTTKVVNGENQIIMSAAANNNVANDALTLSGKNTKDLFTFPLLLGTGGNSQANYTQDASETIWQLPNGLQGYALWDGAGNRVDFADPNVVIDTQTPLGNKVINNANSCSRCHNQGLIPLVDEVRAHVNANAAQFIANDVQLVNAVYKTPPANVALFKVDNKQYTKALAALSVDEGADPMNVVTDRFLQNWTLNQAAAFLFLTPDEFTEAVNASPVAKQAIGTLLTGGTVTFVQFTGVLQQLIADARLFQDPLTDN
jgi:hypothetical protein